ncbi:MAG TPA: nitric-oxide reductase large subunit [Pyrinomonadaceae bacterium]|nr:nitric-oxide reductase large subunit [Pyrinomonadaceae bacterium]
MKKLWMIFGLVFVLSFTVLLWIGSEIFRQAPPIPQAVVTTDGKQLIGEEEISNGQNVWQAMGGMQIGSIWGHGSYVAPDWTAEYLHREAVFILDDFSRTEFGKDYSALTNEQQAVMRFRVQELMRKNTFDEKTGILTLDPVRARAFEDNLKYYSNIFANGNKDFAIQKNAQSDPVKLREMTSFFFWTAWASAANRPGKTISYTSNFPAEPLVGNTATSDTILWTGVSVIVLIAGIGGIIWFFAGTREELPTDDAPEKDPLIGATLYPSQKATVKYFLVVSLLFLLQIIMGIITAHYGVEGQGFYGIPLADYLPYVVTRTWHTQLGIFWIATAWLAAGIFIGPIIAGKEPKFQRLGVNILFGALLVVVLGSMAGQWASVMHKLGNGDLWFWFGHQGYEYVDLGRFWQIALLIGLLLWLVLVLRTAIPALKKSGNQKSLIILYIVSTAGIALFYSPGLFWGMRSHISVVEYWRWWVVHLWVEGFFEVFATVVVAFLFAKLGVIKAENAAKASLLSTAIYLSGGIIGTCHHLYFSGTPTVALAFGSVFSALEIVPLTMVGFEAWENIHRLKSRKWLQQYKWVIYFFVAVAFWNLVGAGIFGFMINPPIALYYMQGLNTTPLHGHGALYGVYGTLGLALLLFCLRAMNPERVWKEKLLKFSFWTINGGMLAMMLLSLLPIGLMQTVESVSTGYWSARSPEFMQTDWMQFFRWMRIFGDSTFAVGAVAFVWFAIDLMLRKPKTVTEEIPAGELIEV